MTEFADQEVFVSRRGEGGRDPAVSGRWRGADLRDQQRASALPQREAAAQGRRRGGWKGRCRLRLCGVWQKPRLLPFLFIRLQGNYSSLSLI